ncbi:MAG: potassium/proton antiporter [Paludibacteraceae bacterium]|nr:potassium/proton antiporter [Paludibacteraceae bacterium]
MEIYTSEWVLFIGSILIFLSILISKTGYKFGVPTLLLFLLLGMLFGEDGLGLEFNNVKDSQFVGMLAMSIILFNGGVGTNYAEIKPVLKQGIFLSTFGVLLTTLITGSFVYLISYLVHLSSVTTYIATSKDTIPFLTCLLLAATMSSTDSASVFSILKDQKIHLKHNLRPLLELESGSNDPMAYMLTIVLIQIISGGQTTPLDIFTNLLIQFALGGFIGFAMGKCITLLINNINVKNRSLYSIMVLALIFFTFTLSDMANGNGYLAVYIAGIMVGNSKILYRRDISTFLDGMTWFFQIIMFLVLGLLVSPRAMFYVAIPAIIISIIIVFVARPLSVFACLFPYRKLLPANARRYTSWVGLRGAAPIMFATYPLVYGIAGSDMIFNVVFFVTLFSLLVQGMTLSKVAYKLDLVDDDNSESKEYGIELSDEFDRKVREYIITEGDLVDGCRIMDLNVNKGSVIVLVKRGVKNLTPKGSLELEINDRLLLLDEDNGM